MISARPDFPPSCYVCAMGRRSPLRTLAWLSALSLGLGCASSKPAHESRPAAPTSQDDAQDSSAPVAVFDAAGERRSGSITPPGDGPRPALEDPKGEPRFAVATAGRPGKGAADPLVTVIVFSDFQCPYCKRVSSTLDDLLRAYPSDVRIVYRHLPLPFHRQAMPAALAAAAADRQGRFWAMHDLLFANASRLEELAKNDFQELARQLGLDLGQYLNDYNDPGLQRLVDDDIDVAGRFGATGTPSFFINGRKMSGARPFDDFADVIEEERTLAIRFGRQYQIPRGQLYAAMLQGWLDRGDQASPAIAGPSPSPKPAADHQRRTIDLTGLPRQPASGGGAVTIVECGDFDDPFSKRASDTIREVLRRYPGRVAVYFAHDPLPMHKRAEPAARAAWAAQQQGNFWPMHDRMFAQQKKRDGGDLAQMARELGLDVGRFRRDMTSAAAEVEVRRQITLCQSLGVGGVPTFFFNGRLMSGAQPIERFVEVIDEELAGGFEARP